MCGIQSEYFLGTAAKYIYTKNNSGDIGRLSLFTKSFKARKQTFRKVYFTVTDALRKQKR